MRVIYFYRLTGDIDSGVNKKISFQIARLAELGVRVEIYPVSLNEEESIAYQPFNNYSPIRILLNLGLLKKLKREIRINGEFRKVIESLSSGDILYARLPYPMLSVVKKLREHRSCKIVFECQTIEPREYRLRGKYWYLVLDYLFGRLIRKYSDGIVGVTEEITMYQVTRSGNECKPHITIGNGFDVDSVQVRSPPSFTEDKLDLLCVANVNKWHGLDRLIQGIAAFSGPTTIHLHVAGDGPEILAIKKLIADLHLQRNVTFHGFVTGSELDFLFQSCHIAVGSVGIHRIGLTEASILKAREYCARGIPFITGCSDPDFPDSFPFVLNVSADDCPIVISEILEFTRLVFQEDYHPEIMHEYASMHLDWSIKMVKLKNFFETLVSESPEYPDEVAPLSENTR